jgi:hypothetical protein
MEIRTPAGSCMTGSCLTARAQVDELAAALAAARAAGDGGAALAAAQGAADRKVLRRAGRELPE